MKKKIVHLFSLLNTRIVLRTVSLPGNIKNDVYKSFVRCYKLIKQKNNSEVICKIGNYNFKSPDPVLLQLLLREIMINEQYYIELNNDTPLIIDCGANLGFSILYFKLKFPNARIIGVEANPETFNILSENVKQLKGVTVYNGYIHNVNNSNVDFYSKGAGDVTASFDSGRGGQVRTSINTISLHELIGNEKVDLLKIDIEGGEYALFNKKEDVSYLKNVKNALIEYHHNINDSASNSFSEFLSVFEENGFLYNMEASISRKQPPYFQDVFLKMKK